MIGAVILAAGSSSRLGTPKQLLPLGGTTLVEAIVDRVLASSSDRVAVVLGARAEEIAPRLASRPVDLLANDDWAEGMAASLRAAVAWARRTACDALLVTLVDQPRLTTAHLDQLLDAHRDTGHPVASRYGESLGAPAVFGRALFEDLAELRGDRGARQLLARCGARAIDWADGHIDIDVPADLRHLA